MNVLVTGGTGFVGREVVRQLHDAGHPMRVLVRHRDSSDAREIALRYGAELREGDVLNPSAMTDAAVGADAIIHLVGIISEFGDQTFENIHTRGTKNVVHAGIITGARRFLHMSALGTRINACSRYHKTKWAAEQAISQSGLDWTIFRPSVIYGPQDHFVNLFARMAKSSPVIPVFGDGKALLQPVAVEDVARCFVRALTEPRSIGETLDVCGPERFTLPELLQKIFEAIGRKRMIVKMPIELADALAWCLEFYYPTFLRKGPPLNRDQLLMLRENNVGDARWTEEMFMLQQPSFAEGIARYLK